MKIAFLLLFFPLLACTAPPAMPSTPTPTPTPRTHPFIPAKRRTMVAKCENKPVVIAVIDTGFNIKGLGDGRHLCKFGHKDFTSDDLIKDSDDGFGTNTPVPVDNHGHGTNIAGVIDKYASGYYCLVIIKYFDHVAKLGEDTHNLERTVSAIKYAANIHADIINYSGGGEDTSKEEITAVKDFLDHGGTFIAAAGNDHSELAGEDPKTHKHYAYYPAMDDERVMVVGNGDGKEKEQRSPTSNYGEWVDVWEHGENVTGNGITMTGSSQATAITTGKVVSKINHACIKNNH